MSSHGPVRDVITCCSSAGFRGCACYGVESVSVTDVTMISANIDQLWERARAYIRVADRGVRPVARMVENPDRKLSQGMSNYMSNVSDDGRMGVPNSEARTF